MHFVLLAIYQCLYFTLCCDYLGASPAAHIAPSLGKLQQAVGGRALRGYAIAPVLLFHSAIEHGSFLAMFHAPLHKTTKPLQSLARSPQYGSNE